MMNSKFLLFASLGVCLSLSAHCVQSEQLSTTFWVAPHLGRCHGPDNVTLEPCNTLAGYQQDRNIFSTSNSTWIFLKGEHAMDDIPIRVQNAANITWMGQPECWGEVHPVCRIMLPRNIGKKFRVAVYIHQSSSITLMALAFQDTMERGSNLLAHSAFMLIEVAHFHLINVVNNLYGKWYAVFRIICPSGHYLVKNYHRHGNDGVKFDMYTLIDDNVSDSYRAADHNFTLEVESSSFLNEVGLAMWGDVAAFMANVNVTCAFSSFRRVVVAVDNYPTSAFRANFSYCIFRSESMPDSALEMWLGIVPQSFSPAYSQRKQPWCTITDSTIIGALEVTWTCNSSNDGQIATNCQAVLPRLQVRNTSILITDSTSMAKKCAICMRLQPLVFPQNCSFSRPVFSIQDSVVHKVNKTNEAMIVFQDFHSLRVSFSGNVQVFGDGTALYLANTHLEIHGYCEFSITGTSTRFAALLSSNSTLLLTNNSFLNMSNIHLCSQSTYALFHQSMQGSIGIKFNNYQSFIDCYVDKTTCPGYCFFQFIDGDSGHFLQNEEELPFFNATIDVICDSMVPIRTVPPWKIENGHLFGCYLQTRRGAERITSSSLERLFNTSMDKLKQQSHSPPYAICLCNTPLSPTFSECQRNVGIELYPVSHFPLSLVAVKDFLLPTVAQVQLHITADNIEQSYSLKTNTYGCTTLPTLDFVNGIEQYKIIAKAVPGLQNPYFLESNAGVNKAILITLASRCPPGMGINYVAEGISHVQCSCNQHLARHGFNCTTDGINVQYLISTAKYWVGVAKGKLLFSDYCPRFYCNSTASRRFTLKHLNSSLHCNVHNRRHRLLCSECPSGYSSVFGSFKCRRCSSAWLLQLPLHALGGVLIIALLFLFNLTLLQGTIIGVVLYANIMGLMEEFLHEYAWEPLSFLLSVLNFQSGAGVCFYDGMDQFAKALLQFAFPFYLFTLLIVIIIVTHKCGYRMFRKARFIARRAVPVLATIMVLTYTSLVSTVIVPLRYTTLYDADTAQGETVWLYQPSLPFFGGQHLVLGILSITVTVLYLIPFTFTMLFGDLMRRYFHKLWFSHFMDVLHGGFKWPLGFWIGFRLLLRVILVVINISTNPNIIAFCTLVTAGTLLVVQLLVKPFRDPNQFREDIHLQGPPSCKRKCLTWMKKFLNAYHAPLFDTLYLQNIVLMSAIAFGSSSQTEMLSVAGVNILILLALVQFAVILVYHAYNFFPVPERARSCAQSCWSTMRAIPSMLKDTQCCQRGPREEEEPRRSPIPILILRPPEIDESYDSETETCSPYSEQPTPEGIEVRESQLQEPLLAQGN